MVSKMDSLSAVQRAYPDAGYDSVTGPAFRAHGYDRMVETFGEVVCSTDFSKYGYHGDSMAVVRSGDSYGLVTFGWGSCSFCDALQSCQSYQDLATLRDDIERGIQWFDLYGLQDYVQRRDWELTFHGEPSRDFLDAIEGIRPY